MSRLDKLRHRLASWIAPAQPDRSDAVLRVAKAELAMLLGWPDSIDEQWEHAPEELRGRLLLLGERAVAALDDLLVMNADEITWRPATAVRVNVGGHAAEGEGR